MLILHKNARNVRFVLFTKTSNVYVEFAVEVTSAMVVALMTELFMVPDRESLWESWPEFLLLLQIRNGYVFINSVLNLDPLAQYSTALML